MRPSRSGPVGIMFPLVSPADRGGWSQGWLVGGDAGRDGWAEPGRFLPLYPLVVSPPAKGPQGMRIVSFSGGLQGHSPGAGEMPIPRSFAHLEESYIALQVGDSVLSPPNNFDGCSATNPC